MDQWYKIDNTGKIFHAVSDASNSSVYRVSMLLNEKIDPKCLQEALDIVAIRFPTLTVRVRKGLFWDFMEKNDALLEVKKETDYPCAPIDRKENNAYLIRVLYFERRISVEIFHSLTDGGGAVEFLKTLTYQYLKTKGYNITSEGAVLLPRDVPKREEMEDSFERYSISKTIKAPGERAEKSFQFKGKTFDTTGISVIHGVINAQELNTFAKTQGTSLTGFLTALMIDVIRREEEVSGERITIAVPMSLRKHFPSETLRNFFAVANIGVKTHAEMTLDEIINEVTAELIRQTDKEKIQNVINRFVSLESSLWTRMVPVFIKYPVMRFGFNQLGERAKTMTMSNLGNIKIPDTMKPYVDRMELVLYPTKKSPINCGLTTVNNQLTITFARSIEEKAVIQQFFKTLTNVTGLKIKVYSNGWEEER